MQTEDAIALITGAVDHRMVPQTWAELGSGSGTFTKALASLLPTTSTIHAIDRQMQTLPKRYKNADIHFKQADFEKDSIDLNNLNGILLANALHYVKDQQSLMAKLATCLQQNGRFLLIEYDHRKPNRWVPYPVPFASAKEIFAAIGFNVTKLAERASAFGDATMYSCIASIPQGTV
jgi:ubiquinone/menaquinone biosynthesis C-methylase UbiE